MRLNRFIHSSVRWLTSSIIEPQTGHEVYVDQFHNMQVTEATRLVGTTFVGTTKDTNFWAETVLNSASVAQANGLVTLTSGTNTAGSIIYQSTRKARFVPVTVQMFRAVGKMDSGIASNKRIWGMYDGTDGVWFQLDGTTLGIATKAGASAAVVVTAANFNRSAFTMDTNFHGYEIRCGYSSYHFYIDGRLVHEISVEGSADLPCNTLTLPVYAQNINAGNTTSKDMSFVLMSIYRLGKLNTAPTYKQISTATTTICKYGAGMLHKIILNNPTNNTITVYDNTAASGTVIAIINPGASATPFSLPYDVGFGTGLTIVTAGTPNLTVIYE